ncbi:PBP1A family penicillin-binding protein [uncultured Tolumonas sp.]|uniref:penicillin-binding protein 1A n=1 Tax=uncultured Tolumonas sp. TaxID=263765 RepID=UPI0029305576|nr:PBP1A family penicillin-binding protein [uncultured Tolumonas sp.]
MARKSTKVRKPASSPRELLRLLGWGLLGLAAVGAVTLAVMWSIFSRDADNFLAYFSLRPIKTISKVMDRNGDTIGVFAEENREVIPFGDIPKAFMNALVATEDADFMNHSGVSGRGLVRAAWNFVTSFGQRREGASTLTMQLIRTVTDKRQKRLDRKLQEIILARKLEKAYTKKQILEMYANEVNFGGGRYGIEAAAKYYFGKSAPQLNKEECALLAGLVQRPSYYNPYNSDPKARAAALVRRNHVLDRMVAERYLDAAEAEMLKAKPIRLARGNAQEEDIAPYPVEEIRKYLYEKYGKDAVLTEGLEVYTTLDSAWQEAANKAVRAGVKAADRRRGFRKEAVQFVQDPDKAELPGWKRFLEPGDSVQGVILGWEGDRARVRLAKKVLDVPGSAFAWAGKDVRKLLPRGAAPLFQVKESDADGSATKVELDQDPAVEGALLSVDPPTGEIRAMVGGFSFQRSKFNRSVQAERQVGSTMKAFVYGAAFAQGKNPATLVNDGAIRYTFYSTIYQPQNYEHDFWGPIPIWEALRDSRNVAAVRVLEATGIENVVEFAHAAGIEETIPRVPSMALGSADLTLKDMVRGYATIANGGLKAPPLFLIKKVVDRNGRVLETHEGHPGEAVIDPMSNYQLVQCLQGVAQRGTGARSNELNWPVAGKTGTTEEHSDAWFLGFSTRICTGVWVGLDEKKTIFRGADGAKAALPIWVDFMRVALGTTPKEEFPVPEGMEWADIDRYTGLIATSATQPEDLLHLAFKPGTLPKSPSTADVIQKVREARERAHYQPAENREWGTGSLFDASVLQPGPVDWKQIPDPNK